MERIGEACGERLKPNVGEDVGEDVNDVARGFDGEAWAATRRQLKDMRMERGIAAADALWVERPFHAWLRNLDCGDHDLSHAEMSALAVGMAESLAIRDALIVSLVTQRGVCDEKRMISFAARPHDPRNVSGMYRMLQRAFDDADAALDHDRCRTGLAMMKVIYSSVPVFLQTQPLALMGYIHWWMGDDEGLPYALDALQRDVKCTLASIVRSAYEHDIRPANARSLAR